MDIKTKRRLAERVRRALTMRLKEQGFVRGKPTFWVRPREHVIEFVHLHLYTFDPAFRAHLGIRALNDKRDGIALNGPTDGESGQCGKPKYNFDFSEEDSSIIRCTEEIARFCSEVGEPWFHLFANPKDLLATELPLIGPSQADFAEAIQGHSNAEATQLSRRLLGVA
jgi:hypothetical protein